MRRDNGGLSGGNQIQQGRFADIGCAGKNNLDARSKRARAICLRRGPTQTLYQVKSLGLNFGERRGSNTILFNKINCCFEARKERYQFRSPNLILGTGTAEHVVHGHTPLSFSAGMKQIGKPFRLNQIHPVVDESPPAKFPGLCQSHPGDRTKYTKHRVNDRSTSMHMKFADIFTGRTRRARHPQDQCLVNDLP